MKEPFTYRCKINLQATCVNLKLSKTYHNSHFNYRWVMHLKDMLGTIPFKLNFRLAQLIWWHSNGSKKEKISLVWWIACVIDISRCCVFACKWRLKRKNVPWNFNKHEHEGNRLARCVVVILTFDRNRSLTQWRVYEHLEQIEPGEHGVVNEKHNFQDSSEQENVWVEFLNGPERLQAFMW